MKHDALRVQVKAHELIKHLVVWLPMLLAQCLECFENVSIKVGTECTWCCGGHSIGLPLKLTIPLRCLPDTNRLTLVQWATSMSQFFDIDKTATIQTQTKYSLPRPIQSEPRSRFTTNNKMISCSLKFRTALCKFNRINWCRSLLWLSQD